MKRIVNYLTILCVILMLLVGWCWVSHYRSYPSWPLAVQNRDHAWIIDGTSLRYVWRDPTSPSPPPTNYRSFGIPFLHVFVALSILPLLRVRRRIYDRIEMQRQARPGRCARCGYDLRSTPQEGGSLLDRCPECGTPSAQRRLHRDPLLARILLLLTVLAFGIPGIVFAFAVPYVYRKVNEVEATKLFFLACIFLVVAIAALWRGWRGPRDFAE